MANSVARSRGARRILLFVLLGVAVAGIGAAGVAFRAYDNATQTDRRYSEAVVGEFIDASLVRRDDARASLYTCAGQKFAQITELRTAIEKDEREHGVLTQVVLGTLQAQSEGRQIDAELQIRRESAGVATKELQRWRFTMVEDDGWRVCGAERLPDPSPSLTPTASPSSTQPTVP